MDMQIFFSLSLMCLNIEIESPGAVGLRTGKQLSKHRWIKTVNYDYGVNRPHIRNVSLEILQYSDFKLIEQEDKYTI